MASYFILKVKRNIYIGVKPNQVCVETVSVKWPGLPDNPMPAQSDGFS